MESYFAHKVPLAWLRHRVWVAGASLARYCCRYPPQLCAAAGHVRSTWPHGETPDPMLLRASIGPLHWHFNPESAPMTQRHCPGAPSIAVLWTTTEPPKACEVIPQSTHQHCFFPGCRHCHQKTEQENSPSIPVSIYLSINIFKSRLTGESLVC